MNKVIMIGRLTKDPDVRYGGANNTAIARYGIAVERRFKKDGDPDADFFNCVSFGKTGEFVERYLHKGSKVAIDGELRNNNYKDRDGNMVYRDEINVANIEFAESKNSSGEQTRNNSQSNNGGFVNVNDDLDDMPFI